LKILKSIRDGVARKAQTNLSLAIYSLLIAILAWFVISMTFYPSVPKTIKNVDLSLDISGSSAAENGLSVIDCDVKQVNVRIKGSRTQVGNIDASSLVAYIDAENVKTTGTKTLTIKVRSENGDNFELESVYPETANVVFDKIETREFAVKPKIPNIKYSEGKALYLEEFVCSPEVVNITAPTATLDNIANCYAVSQKELTLDSSYSLPSDKIQIYAEDGTEIDTNSNKIKFSTTAFNITIPVLTQKNVDLTVSLVGGPDKFDSEWFKSKLRFSNGSEKIAVASKSSQAVIADPLEIGKVVISEVDIDPAYSTTFQLTNMLKSNNMINMSNLDEVTVSLDTTDLVKRTFVLDHSKITASNGPNSFEYDYNVATLSLTFDAIGPADVMKDLTASDFTADANLLSEPISSDQFSKEVTISCSKSDKVWSPSKKIVIIQRTPHVQTTTKESETDTDQSYTTTSAASN